MTDLTVESYNGIPVRVVMTEIGKAIPAGDVAKALGCSRNRITKIVAENPHLFAKGVSIIHPLPTAGGSQKHTCFNDAGLVSVLMRISVASAETEGGKERIEKFQVWARDTLTGAAKNSGVPNPTGKVSITSPVNDPIQIAIECKKLAKVLNADAQRLIVSAYFKHGFDYLAPHVPPHSVIMQKPLTPVVRIVPKTQTTLSASDRPLIESITEKNMIAPSPKPAGMLNASDIGKICGLTPEQVNNKLYNILKYIIKDGENLEEWRITELGKAYGVEKPYRPNPNVSGFYRVFWNREILEKFNVKVV